MNRLKSIFDWASIKKGILKGFSIPVQISNIYTKKVSGFD